MPRFFGSIHDVLSALDAEFGRQQIKKERFKEGLATGKLPGVQGRSTKQELAVGLAEANTALAMIDEFRSMVKDINPKAIAELHNERLPNWTCLTCGSDQSPDDLIHSNRYCEWTDKTDHPCITFADYVITVEGHKILVKAPGGDDIDFKVCRKHLPEVFDKFGQVQVKPVDAPEPEAVQPPPPMEDVQEAFDRASEATGGQPPETFTLGDS